MPSSQKTSRIPSPAISETPATINGNTSTRKKITLHLYPSTGFWKLFPVISPFRGFFSLPSSLFGSNQPKERLTGRVAIWRSHPYLAAELDSGHLVGASSPGITGRKLFLFLHFWYGCFPKNRVWYPKMDGENNGKHYFLMDDMGGTNIFGNTHILEWRKAHTKKANYVLYLDKV